MGIRFVMRTGALAASTMLVAGVMTLPVLAGASTRSSLMIDTHRVIGGVVARDIANRARSQAGSLRGRSAPRVTENPANVTVTAGSSATFSAAATGSPTPTVQWQESTNGGTTYTSIAKATSDTLTVASTTTGESGDLFRAVFTNSSGSADTTGATLTVGAATPTPAAVTADPQSVTVSSGSSATFSATGTGSPTPTVQWQESDNGGVSFTPLSGATSSTLTLSATSSESGDEFEAVFTNTVNGVIESATTTAATLTVTPAQSSNWSGYADVDSTFSAVSANWVVPTVTCSGSGSTYSSMWIGIDGYSSGTVEQDGTEQDCLAGKASYDAWYEMYGDNAVDSGNEVELSPSSYPVSPGDTMNASVRESANVWTLSISDSTKGWSYSTNVTFAAAQSSAEWIVERPEICSRTCALATASNFGTAAFTGAAATSSAGSGSISASAYSAMEMVNGSTVLAVPSSLTANGSSFTDTYQ